ncbi:MAG: hypothetical protein IPK66_03845 [Rhodospirillales bacterium]|nr:hypothetical protein [Rhodospirillales bacterium]
MATPTSSPLDGAGRSRWFAVFFWFVALAPMLCYWWWDGRPIAVAEPPSAQVPCVSFAPYQDDQSPFDEDLMLSPAQIDRDLARLESLTRCVRTYSVNHGLEAVPEIARARGMTVMLGAWIGRKRAKNERELATVIDLANRYPETVSAVVVGNEVLLRREQPPAALAAMIERVRKAVHVPVTYADVWEFWKRYPDVARAVDFVTIHTLPYWEDDPKPIDEAVAHVVEIWRMMSETFPDKRVFIGEAGWPSAGRMREGARPGVVNQARFVRELMAAAERAGIGLNLIESFDQPWKRRLEGTVGGHWGLLDAERAAKFPLFGPVSDDPCWTTKAGFTTVLSLILLLPTLMTRRLSASGWLVIALGASAAATLLVVGVYDGLIAARTVYDWLVLCLRALCAVASAVLVFDACARSGFGADRENVVCPLSMEAWIAALRRGRLPDSAWRPAALGLVRAVSLFSAAASTLCLVFDPRYRDFPSALYAIPAIAFLLLAIVRRRTARHGVSAISLPTLAEERLLATVLAAGGLVVAVQEGIDNHQALGWTAMALVFAAAVVVDRMQVHEKMENGKTRPRKEASACDSPLEPSRLPVADES